MILCGITLLVYGVQDNRVKLGSRLLLGPAVPRARWLRRGLHRTELPGLLLVLNDSAAKDTAIGRLWETNYDSDSKKNFFAVNFDMKQLKALSLDGRDVEFSYNAELMGEAQTTGTDNTANLKYSNDPFNPATFATTTHTNKLYTYDVKLDKLFSDGATTDFYDDVSFKIEYLDLVGC